MKDKTPGFEALFDSPREGNPYPMEDEWETADFRKWARVPYWSAEECVALIFGKDPQQISVQDVEDALPETAPFAQNYIAVHERILAAQRNKELPERIRPVEFLDWAKQNNYRICDDFEKAISMHYIDIANLQERCEQLEQRHLTLSRKNQELRDELDRARASSPSQSKEPSTNEEPSKKIRNSLNKLILGMAMAKYKWNPDADRHPAASKIAEDLKHLQRDNVNLGLGLDQETVLKYLREAKDVLP